MTIGEEKSCRICGLPQLLLVRLSGITGAISSADFAITESHYGITGALYRCSNCGFLQCNDMNNVLCFYETLEDPAYEEGREQRTLQACRLLNIVKRYVSNGRLVDIGAGSGILVEAASKVGYQAEGVEPSRWLRERALVRGLKIHSGIYPNENILPGFEIVTLVDVIEHVPSPVQLLHDVALQLAESGIGLVVTPDVGSLTAKLMGRRWWHFRLAHIGYFNRSNLLLALDKAGFVPVEVGRPGWYFTASYIVERLNRYLPNFFQLPAMGFMRRLTIPVNLRDSLYVVFKKKPA